MKKLYIDIRFAKCILALTAGGGLGGGAADGVAHGRMLS